MASCDPLASSTPEVTEDVQFFSAPSHSDATITFPVVPAVVAGPLTIIRLNLPLDPCSHSRPWKLQLRHGVGHDTARLLDRDGTRFVVCKFAECKSGSLCTRGLEVVK